MFGKVGVKLKILSLYIDDVSLVGNDMYIIHKTKSCLGLRFEIKDRGGPCYLLEIKILTNQTFNLILDQFKILKRCLRDLVWTIVKHCPRLYVNFKVGVGTSRVESS